MLRVNAKPPASYELPYRVHIAQVYPVLSPNGSSVILCGHEQGLLIIWRGGRSFKPSGAESEKKQASPITNGTNTDMIILDSDSDDDPAQPDQQYTKEPVFEEQESEYDPHHPYEPIIQKLELQLGTEVLHIAFPQSAQDLESSNLGSLPRMLVDKLLVAVACADCSVRILTIPIMPPLVNGKIRPNSRLKPLGAFAGNGLFGEKMLVLSRGSGLQSLPKGVSVSLTAHTSVEGTAENDPESENRPFSRMRSLSHEQYPAQERTKTAIDGWAVLVASHFADVSDLLLIYRIPILSGGGDINVEDPRSSIPWQTQYLRSPAISIQFNYALYPASRHSQVLITEPNGIVRIFDCHSLSGAERGTWLISLYTDYDTPESSVPKRKRILAAKWILGGKAIVVLQADGVWGLWDLEGGGLEAKHSTSAEQAPAGVNLSKFAIKGRVGSLGETSKALAPAESRLKLAPMTPGTRKVKEETLFTGPIAVAVSPTRGGVSIMSALNGHGSRADDETVLFWYGDCIMILPSLLTYWQNKVNGPGSRLGAVGRDQAQQLKDVRLGGEICNGVAMMPCRSAAVNATSPTSERSVLITGEHRLVVVAPRLAEPLISTTPEPPTRSEAMHQALLAQGELDVNGIDSMLDEMTNMDQRNGTHGNGTMLKLLF